MPLNDDPEALPDADYWAMVGEDAQPCSMAIPPDVLAEALARLEAADDDHADYENGEQ